MHRLARSRFPLVDPDEFLEKRQHIVEPFIGKIGLAVWLLVVGSALILAITIIGIPFAVQHVKLIPLALLLIGLATAAFYHLEKDNTPIPDNTGLTRRQGSQRSRGLELELRVWDDPELRGEDYAAVVVGTTWDYQDRVELFLSRMEALAARRRVFRIPAAGAPACRHRRI